MQAKISRRQKRLATLIKSTSGMIKVDDAMNTFDIGRQQASKLLSNWHNQGIIRRVSQGVYVLLHPSALDQLQVLDDPWILVPELFTPGYIGGWSALEHWGLTEQVFRSVCVLTNKRIKNGVQEIQGVDFFIKHISERFLFGTKVIWRGHIKIMIADPHKTILDILNEPYLGAGIQHTFDSFKEYVKIYKDEMNKVFEYAERIDNGAIFKKLGYFSEVLNLDPKLIKSCKEKLTEGFANLDHNMKERKLITRWKLWVPEGWPTND